MNKAFFCIILLFNLLLISCAASKKNYSVTKKYPKQALQKDYVLLKNILEKKHPSLYWYTSKDSMDFYFDKYYRLIGDSMTELQFAWQILVPLTDKIHCGHTSVSMSKAYTKWAAYKKFPSFPLYLKVWGDTMAVTGNLIKKDSVFKRGTIVTAINGIPRDVIIKRMFDFLPEDGHANNINFIRLSANFPYFHRNIFGLSKTYAITHINGDGKEQTDTLPVFIAAKDSIKKDSLTKIERKNLPHEKKILQYRSLQIDSSGKFAIMNLNTFSNGRLRKFFRKSFKELRKKNVPNLILDVRNNGGGRVGLSTLLTKYISRQPFKVADTLFAKSRNLAPYTKYIHGNFFNNIELLFITSKKKDGLYHIHHLEKKIYQPKKKNHYNGNVYTLINGPTFSAAALFCNAIKGQPGIKLAGEETGGGWYGNDGIMIPDIKLPNTKLRVRLPLFRLVQYRHIAEKGSGIPPDIYIPTSYDALMKGYDKKIKVIKEIILQK